MSNSFACQQTSHLCKAVQGLEAGKLMGFLSDLGAFAVVAKLLQTSSSRNLKTKKTFKKSSTNKTQNKIKVILQVMKSLESISHPLGHGHLAYVKSVFLLHLSKERYAVGWNHCHLRSSVDTSDLKPKGISENQIEQSN